MRVGWLLLAAALVAASGCGTTVNWGKYMPRETPRMTAARFQLAIKYGPTSDSWKSLTEASQGVVGSSFRWKLVLKFGKDPDTDVKIRDIITESKVDACYETDETTAETLTYYEPTKQAYTIRLFLEDDEWKVGVVETFMPDKAREWKEEQQNKKESEENKVTGEAEGTGREVEVGVLETRFGNVVVEFYPDLAPKTVARIKELIADEFYNGLIFHRIVPGFCVQGGDPTGTGRGGTGVKIPGEFTKTPFEDGSLGMARSADPDSNDCQFFITLGRIPNLDNQYTLFGKVIEGIDIVHQMEKVPLAGEEGFQKPVEEVRIDKFTLEKRAVDN